MKLRVLLISALAAMALVLTVSLGYGHNNSAPNFDCTDCHTGGENAEMVVLEGLPSAYSPGKQYSLTLKLKGKAENEIAPVGGFALRASHGKVLVKDKKNTQMVDGILTHTQEGSEQRQWSFLWVAPKGKQEESLTVMAIVANGDYAPLGDVLGASSFTIKPGK